MISCTADHGHTLVKLPAPSRDSEGSMSECHSAIFSGSGAETSSSTATRAASACHVTSSTNASRTRPTTTALCAWRWGSRDAVDTMCFISLYPGHPQQSGRGAHSPLQPPPAPHLLPGHAGPGAVRLPHLRPRHAGHVPLLEEHGRGGGCHSHAEVNLKPCSWMQY